MVGYVSAAQEQPLQMRFFQVLFILLHSLREREHEIKLMITCMLVNL